ncbi:hypothetical protein HK098_000439 [Nowakowskiella sp. JEL0407]|nr:hypothetical protein HK098_000439 [Nowakowskiella sp. JEL0407]
MVVRVDDPTTLNSTLLSLDPSKKYLLYVFGKELEIGEFIGQSWCPDCRQSDSVIYPLLENFPDIVSIKAPVIREDYKGNPEYIYRKDPNLKLTGVPTLYSLNNGIPVKRLVDSEAWDVVLVENLLRSL